MYFAFFCSQDLFDENVDTNKRKNSNENRRTFLAIVVCTYRQQQIEGEKTSKIVVWFKNFALLKEYTLGLPLMKLRLEMVATEFHTLPFHGNL